MENPLLEKCLKIAKESGSPSSQVANFLNRGYIPLPWQWKFHAAARDADDKNGPVMIGVGGSRGPGKSHSIFAQISLDDCQRVPGLKGLFLRQTGKAAKESFEDLIERVLAGKTEYEFVNSMLKFPNGSRVLLGGFKNENDIDRYIGIEYDVIGGEELNQLSEGKITKIRGSLRTSKLNWRPRLYASFNPGGIGHGFVKTKFVTPFKMEIEKETRYVPATYRENPFLNDEYAQFLEGLTGQLGQSWREGDFDILAGQYFPEWNERLHVVDPYEIPKNWRRLCGLDYGYTAPSSLGWYAVDPDGRLVKYRELYRSGLTYTQLAEEFVALTGPKEKIEYLVADPSIWNKDGKMEYGLSGADKFAAKVKELTGRPIRLVRGNNDRITGWGILREYLRPKMREDKLQADLTVFSSCINFIRTIPEQVHDQFNPEDLNTDGEEHAMDETRYVVMSKPQPGMTRSEMDAVNFRHMLFGTPRKRKNVAL